MARTPRLRFAPSPTGPLHLGGSRTALYNWAAARAMGGTFLLRIEDTDRARSSEQWLESILDGLRWLGLDWDEGPDVGGEYGPYFQSQRLHLYRSYAERCLEAGVAYRCYATPEEVEEGRKALAARGQKPMYDRRHRDLTEEQRARFEAEGRRPSLRFRMPLEGKVTLRDLIRGESEIDLAELDDWVMVRPDGMPTYNFACVVDDLEMGITHVVRGEEHFLNSVKQLLLYRVFEAEPPAFAHLPLILGKDGKKLSKREAATNVLDYRDAGYPADAVFNYIALLGWGFSGDRDLFTREEMIERFRLENVGKAGARFDEEKLRALCGAYVRAMSIEDLVEATRPFLVRAGVVPREAYRTHPGLLRNAVACYQERIQIYGELPQRLAWLFQEVLEFDAAARKNLARHEEAPRWLEAYAAELEERSPPPSYPADRGDADDRVRLPTRTSGGCAPEECGLAWLSPRQLEQRARALAEGLNAPFGRFVRPVRAALTGTDRGPGLFDVVFLLGKERAVARLRAAARGA